MRIRPAWHEFDYSLYVLLLIVERIQASAARATFHYSITPCEGILQLQVKSSNRAAHIFKNQAEELRAPGKVIGLQ